MAENVNSHIFDDVFRTMEEHTPELMIPLINEVFKTNYPEDAEITRLGDKRHLLQTLIETDSCMSIGNKVYHFECESNPNNGIIAIRMFQYDVTVAIEGKYQENDRYVVEFPASCLVYLRHNSNTKNKENVLVRMPDGRELEYMVPVLKSQLYSKKEIFEKKLYVLLPYYILRYEKHLALIEKEEERRHKFFEEYEDICTQLRKTLGEENPLAYSELCDLMKRILDYVLKKKTETQKGVQQIMGGKVLESWRERTLREGREEGREEQRKEQREKLEEKVRIKIGKGKSVAQIAEELEEDIAVIEKIYQKIIAEAN